MKSYEEVLSKKSDYYVEKERYYELLHHCRQYADWMVKANDILTRYPQVDYVGDARSTWNDVVCSKADEREKYLKNIERVDRLCKRVCPEAHSYLLMCIAGGYSYDLIEAKMGTLPVTRKQFYQSYREFFWLLDKEMK